MRETNFEKLIVASGGEIITWEHEDIMDFLLQIFNRDYDSLLLMAASDDTKRRELCFVLDCGEVNFGGTVI